MSSSNNDMLVNDLLDNKFSGLECLIKFILILDNNGKRIYCNYYCNNELNTYESQIEFEKKLCQITITYNIEKDDIDIFNYDKYNILSEIDSEVAFFIGQDENDNELLLKDFYDAFKIQLYNITKENSLTREKLLNNYDKLVILIDEMISNGIVMNIDEHSLYDRTNNKDTQKNIGGEKNKNSGSKGGIMSGFFSYFTGSSQTPNEEKIAEEESKSVFGNLMNGAKGYLSKSINY